MTKTPVFHASLKDKKVFTTTILKVVRRDGASHLILKSHPDLEISLGDKTAGQLGFGKGIDITVTPDKAGGKGHYTLSLVHVPGITETPAKKAKALGKPSSPAFGFKIKNELL